MQALAHMSGCPSKLGCESRWVMIVGMHAQATQRKRAGAKYVPQSSRIMRKDTPR